MREKAAEVVHVCGRRMEMKFNQRAVSEEHLLLSRRYFLQAAGTSLAMSPLIANAQLRVDLSAQAHAAPEYLTKQDAFGTVERGNPPPYQLPEPRLREIGMTRETWQLEVVPDTGTTAQVERPLSRERGTALDWPAFMRLAERRSVRFLKVITCNNLNSPLGMGLWEGVPLRDVVWLAAPTANIRRVFYYGHHNEDPKQIFRGSLSLSRVLEDPPGDYPVILAYKLNGEALSGRRGGPVRIIVPEAYGFKSVKWIQRIVLTNLPGANDTYAEENNDIDSWMKTVARFLTHPEEVKAGSAIAVSGVAQAGVSGLRRVQVWLHPRDAGLPPGDPHFTTAPWRDAQLLATPTRWGGGLPEGRMPPDTLGFDPATGRPKSWPMRYATAHWAAIVPPPAPGAYHLRCRAIDGNGVAQPMPRPVGQSGMNAIEQVSITVKRS